MSSSLLCFLTYGDPTDLHSFPTRRSSDLLHAHARAPDVYRDLVQPWRLPLRRERIVIGFVADHVVVAHVAADPADRKSTRLNSSHLVISYAVFCLKKKTD